MIGCRTGNGEKCTGNGAAKQSQFRPLNQLWLCFPPTLIFLTPHVLLPNFEGTGWRGGIGGDQGAWMVPFTLPDPHLSLLSNRFLQIG